MKVIDLLNKIANGEEVPKKIKYDNDIWNYDEISRDYELFDVSGNLYLFDEELNITKALNDEVEIIEEDKQEPKPITKKDLEALGYAFGEMRKALQNGWNKSLNNEPFKEGKKIEKLVIVGNELSDTGKGIVNKINEIIDFINKGE